MCVYIYIYIYTCIHIHTSLSLSLYIYIYIYIYTCTFTHLYYDMGRSTFAASICLLWSCCVYYCYVVLF